MRDVVWRYCGTVLTLGAFMACGGPMSQDLFSAPPEDGGTRSTPTPAAGAPSLVFAGSSAGATLRGAGGTLIASAAGGGGAGTMHSGGDTASGRGGRSSGGSSGNASGTSAAGTNAAGTNAAGTNAAGSSARSGGAPGSSRGGAPAATSAGEGGLSGEGGAETLGGTSGQAGRAASAGLGGGGSGGGMASTCAEIAEVCDGVDNDCDGAIDEGNGCPANCRGFSLGANHGGYMYCSTELTHDQAMQRCERQGMRLATIQSAAENAALLDSILRLAAGAPPSSVRIGATNEPEDRWSWVDGTVFWVNERPVNGAYANWDTGEPNDSIPDGGEDCGTMLVSAQASDAGRWNDVNCSYQFAFVCEAE